MISEAELRALLQPVRAAAREAAELVRTGFRRAVRVEHKGVVDLVTRFDRESEELLRARLHAATPYPVVGEEAGGVAEPGKPCFYVDPLDGTTNFVHGHPFFCVSIGLVDEALPVLGVVTAPLLGLEWYGYATRDGSARQGARRAWGHALGAGEPPETPVAVSDVATLSDALLATGFPYDRRTSSDNNFDAFVAIKRRCQAVRRCGSAALDLCLVADGTYDGYWEKKLGPWDMAGGAALVRSAGGRLTDLEGGPASVTRGHVVATNGRLHDELLAQLAHVRSQSPASGGAI